MYFLSDDITNSVIRGSKNIKNGLFRLILFRYIIKNLASSIFTANKVASCSKVSRISVQSNLLGKTKNMKTEILTATKQ